MKEHHVLSLKWMIRHSSQYVDSEFIAQIWYLYTDGSEDERIAQLACHLGPEHLSFLAATAQRVLSEIAEDQLGIGVGRRVLDDPDDYIRRSFIVRLAEIKPRRSLEADKR